MGGLTGMRIIVDCLTPWETLIEGLVIYSAANGGRIVDITETPDAGGKVLSLK